MERLTAFDASLLYAESSSVPMHVCSIAELDTSTIPGGYSFDGIRSHLASRMRALPELRAKLANSQLNLDHPVWVEDTELDVAHHLHQIALPAPAGRRELSEVCGRIASIPLDRSKPLWEMWVIEGVAGADPHDGPIALMIKVHHAAVDGVSAGNLISQLCDLQPDAPPPDPVDGPGVARPLEIAAGGLVRFLTRPLELTRAVPSTVSTVVSTVGRALTGRAMAAPFTAPATVFNAEITGDRTLALAQLELDDVKRVKNRYGVKVNDVVMALCAGALRGYLEGRGELPEKPLVAVVPASVRGVSDRPGRNQLSGMFCNLKTDISDPVERLQAIAESSSRAKEHSTALAPTLLADVTQAIPPAVLGAAFELMSHTPLKHAPIHNVVISNVAGPTAKLYAMGAEMKALYPLGPIFHGSGLNITVMSLSGKLNVGIITCRQLVDDLWDLADLFRSELRELVDRSR
ncbi:WS/DGAT/MGAT family O-acyltransferase [Mycolicibacterium holsaticum]|uniref:WS/DGAT/MGAT family O-acyltransferase n=1 Tax=Mycolicibacterium holsaticum TaxID=152142 RepID=UPI001C7DAFD8|nr:wax ester/triacylglycerol synthase family O-acyltransferase [Mycolicibacterium holsaticum]MDA4110232.1 diacylglycerol O-acyltransferase [Mycolicibacterium holsaticum DSM 44478 = JCM 12374]QZA11871.1 wax ester/triacylglycerol synthase family O-acyltransferase [Mycolicibacterium holsaticum DSM 44478 = JCM 12374]UNC10641.1 wax ester/triacylglycerol synthase family O-acyltransferase [Mycolicibacterium holsaticum DSM 44478 = JCM 12374]